MATPPYTYDKVPVTYDQADVTYDGQSLDHGVWAWIQGGV